MSTYDVLYERCLVSALCSRGQLTYSIFCLYHILCAQAQNVGERIYRVETQSVIFFFNQF
jgi:hypothetical protein